MKMIQNITKNNFMYKLFHTQFTKKIFVKHNTIQPLGRWQVKKNDNKIDLMIDYANEDHCGSCSYYIKNKDHQQKIQEKTEEEYILEFTLLNSITPNNNNK
jgi:hypothetical protein